MLGAQESGGLGGGGGDEGELLAGEGQGMEFMTPGLAQAPPRTCIFLITWQR